MSEQMGFVKSVNHWLSVAVKDDAFDPLEGPEPSPEQREDIVKRVLPLVTTQKDHVHFHAAWALHPDAPDPGSRLAFFLFVAARFMVDQNRVGIPHATALPTLVAVAREVLNGAHP